MKLPWAFTWLSDCSHIPLFPLLDGHLLAFHSHIFTPISGIACEQLYFSSPLYILFELIWETTGLLVRTQAVSLSLPRSCIVYIKVDRRVPDRNQRARQALSGLELVLRQLRYPALSALPIQTIPAQSVSPGRTWHAVVRMMRYAGQPCVVVRFSFEPWETHDRHVSDWVAHHLSLVLGRFGMMRTVRVMNTSHLYCWRASIPECT